MDTKFAIEMIILSNKAVTSKMVTALLESVSMGNLILCTKNNTHFESILGLCDNGKTYISIMHYKIKLVCYLSYYMSPRWS